MTTHPEGGAGTGPGRFLLADRTAQRCDNTGLHGPHPVPDRGTWTPFLCAGYDPDEFDRLLDEAFGS